MNETKRCARCRTEKSLTEFSARSSYCRTCRTEVNRAYRAQYPDRQVNTVERRIAPQRRAKRLAMGQLVASFRQAVEQSAQPPAPHYRVQLRDPDADGSWSRCGNPFKNLSAAVDKARSREFWFQLEARVVDEHDRVVWVSGQGYVEGRVQS